MLPSREGLSPEQAQYKEAADMKSDYISNEKEEKLLRSDRFQTRIAEGVARSVIEFLPPIPPAAVTVSAGKNEEPKSRDPSVGEEKGMVKRTVAGKRDPASKSGTTYRVKRGDTLGAIAARHGTTIRVLMELNHLKRPDPLYIDRKLVLPTPAGAKHPPE